MIELDKELVTKWVDALESGKFNQVVGALRGRDCNDEIGYCCLGVLAEVIEPNAWMSSSRREHPLQNPDGDELLDESQIEMSRSLQGKYAQMNDEDNASFKEIAQAIRKDFNI